MVPSRSLVVPPLPPRAEESVPLRVPPRQYCAVLWMTPDEIREWEESSNNRHVVEVSPPQDDKAASRRVCSRSSILASLSSPPNISLPSSPPSSVLLVRASPTAYLVNPARHIPESDFLLSHSSPGLLNALAKISWLGCQGDRNPSFLREREKREALRFLHIFFSGISSSVTQDIRGCCCAS